MKINITIEMQDCPYWNYDEHNPKHTCREERINKVWKE